MPFREGKIRIKVASVASQKLPTFLLQVSLLLLPSVDDFEDQLLTTLSDDLTCEGSGVDGSSPISIEERRLKVILYNGWTLVGSPVIGYLDKVSPSAAGRTAGSFRGSTYGLRSNLILKVSSYFIIQKFDVNLWELSRLLYMCIVSRNGA